MNKIILIPLFFFLPLPGLGPLARAGTADPLAAARAALQAGDLAQAATLLTPLTAPGATDAAAFFALGQLRERQHNFKDAVAAYEQATQLDTKNPEYCSTLGLALSRRMSEVSFIQQTMIAGRMKRAFEQSVALDPNHVSGLIGLARYYASAPEIAGGSLVKAKEFADRVHALVPWLGELEYGNIAEKGGDLAGALTHYEAVLQGKPNHPGALLACGRVLARLGRKDEARARYEAVLKIVPDLAPAKQGLADLDTPPPAGG